MKAAPGGILPTLIGLLFFALLAMAPSRAQVRTEHPPVVLTAEQEARYRAMLPILRCLVCQNQSLQDSLAPLAEDLRAEIRTLFAAGQSDEQIIKYLTDRYGEFVLYKPPLRPATILLWAGPGLLVLLGLVMVVVQVRRGRVAAPKPVDPDTLRRLLDEPP
jgi:cytochrome c-type biogenesis protein CcmH